MSAFLATVAVKTAFAYAYFAAFLCLLVAAETAFPRGQLLSTADRLRMSVFAAIYTPLSFVMAMLVSQLVGGDHGPISGWAALVVGVLLSDFLYYWFHRAQHTVPWLWSFHSVHHSIEELGAPAAYNHWLEIPTRALFVYFPLTFIVQRSEAPILSAILSFHGYYTHSSTRMSFGPLGWLLMDNRNHRIHHSIEERHINHNYGRYTMIWDRLFGTAIDHRGEWPKVGLPDQREPRTVGEYLAVPKPPLLARQPQ